MLAYFHAFSGAAGDMIVGALLDAGLSFDDLRQGLSRLAIDGYEVEAAKIRKKGFAATKFEVRQPSDARHPERRLADIVRILRGSDLPPTVCDNAERVFTRLAEAEAKVHGTGVDKVHFHEVGAVDAIVDIVGACLGIELLGITEIVCSPLPVGAGLVNAEHGLMPIPAPATAELLRDVPIAESPELGELTTPTGAAILTTLAHRFGPAPAMITSSIGYGAGTRDGKRVPNLLRVMLGRKCESATGRALEDGAGRDTVWVVEANIDDLPAEIIGYTFDKLFAAGALDVFASPIHMKKNRPAVCLSAIVDDAHLPAVEQMLFTQTSTFGVRRHAVERTKLQREFVDVATALGPVKVKVGRLGQRVTSWAPEFEDCRRIAEASGVPLKEVFAAAGRAFAESAFAESLSGAS